MYQANVYSQIYFSRRSLRNGQTSGIKIKLNYECLDVFVTLCTDEFSYFVEILIRSYGKIGCFKING